VENILKCHLKPLSSADYSPLVLSSAQLKTLHKVFPDGVCDWDRPGVGQQPAISPLDFSDGPGGERLKRAPVSRPRPEHETDDGDRHEHEKHDHDDDDEH
jgi:hypothetical protein